MATMVYRLTSVMAVVVVAGTTAAGWHWNGPSGGAASAAVAPPHHRQPAGTFHVQWKAGPGCISTEYHEPMPYAVFFAAGGIAFHGGSLTEPSHGCVHLTIGNAQYYHDHLPIGAEVVVS
jgi:lipoprotein-anchoring transpeptidase ErfK/SrfK